MTSVLKIQESSTQRIVLKHDMTQESQISKQMEAVLLKSQGTEFERVTETANTLMARDYKGFGNQSMNGVLEWERI